MQRRRESHTEGLATHGDPESCSGVREGVAEALTGAHAGRVLSREMEFNFQVPRPCLEPKATLKPETFDCLGFTHICGKTRKGRFALVRQTMRKRFRAKLREVKEAYRWRWHEPIPEVGKWLASILRGHYNYYAVPLNYPALEAFHHQVVWLWQRGLSRRSHKARITWQRMWRIARRWLPAPRIVHPWPEQRLCLRT